MSYFLYFIFERNKSIDRANKIQRIVSKSYNYLLHIRAIDFTSEKVEKLENELKEKLDKLENIKITTIENIWLKELLELEKEYENFLLLDNLNLIKKNKK